MANNDLQMISELREGLRHTASIDGLVWVEACKRFMDKTQVKEQENVLWYIMSSYMIGRELNDAEMTANAKKILSLKIPDLEKRLPLYALMFDIMDQGEYQIGPEGDAGGPSYYKLNDDLQKRLTDNLAGELGIETGWASNMVNHLASSIGQLPGGLYMSYLVVHGGTENRQLQIIRICHFLHMPMRRLMTVTGEETVADSSINLMQEKH